MTAIVTVNVSQTIAPTPDQLQKTGAFISQGGTTTSPGTKTLLKQASDLTPVLRAPAVVTSLTYSSNTVTALCATAHGLPIGDVISLTISGSIGTTIPTGYNGTFACTITDATHFTYRLTGSTPGGTPAGLWANASAAEISSMATTFFSQGGQQGVYVLELGPGNPAEGVTFLTNWIIANPGTFYSYLVPRSWDSQPSYLTMLGQFEATTAKTYFFTTTTLATYKNYTALMKSCLAMVEAPNYGVWPANAMSDITFSAGWAANVLTAITWAPTNGGTVTATTTTPHSVVAGNSFSISGVTPAGYNGTFIALSGTTASTLIYALATNPGVQSGLGTLVLSVGGTATGTTTTAHGVLPGQSFTIAGSVGATIADGYNGTFVALVGTTGSTLLYSLPANPGTSTIDGTMLASLYASAGVPSTEFSCAAPFWVTLNYDPSTTNKVTPTAFSFLFGVTPFPKQGNAAVIQALQNAAINIVGTGSEGGISTSVLFWGTTLDARDFTYWYSVDWVQIQVDLAISNAIINGSNNPTNPLYYNQDGINRLQQVAAGVMNSGLTFGLVLGAVSQTQLDGAAFGVALNNGTFVNQSIVNAVPFVPYSVSNPTHYKIGEYDGLSVVYTPARGFIHIVFNIDVTDFVTQ